ncbi:hypothetical protein B0H11DRAFT_1932710 [Mycena galericulata]|nr:hypothetical protein B0H11DRAFT_1932710 [Mycena galericulata]
MPVLFPPPQLSCGDSIVMDGLCSTFTFACSLPASGPQPTSALPPAASGAVFTSFAASPSKTPNAHAAAQARYRSRNRDREQEQARERMRRTREERVRRRTSSEQLRASPLFARYRQHVERHGGPLWVNRQDPDLYLAALARFRGKGGPPFDRDDAVFILHHSHPDPPGPVPNDADVDRRLTELNRCTLVIEIRCDDEEEERTWRRISKYTELDDDDLEFIFRRAIPAPTFEAMDGCICHF